MSIIYLFYITYIYKANKYTMNNSIFYKTKDAPLPHSETSVSENHTNNDVYVDSILFSDSNHSYGNSNSNNINARLIDVHQLMIESNFFPSLSEENKDSIKVIPQSMSGGSESHKQSISSSSPETTKSSSFTIPEGSSFNPTEFSDTKSSIKLPNNLVSSEVINYSNYSGYPELTEQTAGYTTVESTDRHNTDTFSISNLSPHNRKPITPSSSDKKASNRLSQNVMSREEKLIEKQLNMQF